MKKISSLVLIALLCNFCVAQKHVASYYDYNKIHPEEDYYVNNVGQKNGPYKQYNRDGVVVREYNFLNGEANGLCVDYEVGEHNQRIIKSKVNYKNGILNGPATYLQHYPWDLHYRRGILQLLCSESTFQF